MTHPNSFNACQTLTVGGRTYTYYSLAEAEKNGLAGISRLPFSMKVLLENLLRYEDGRTVTKADIEAVAAWLDNRGKTEKEIAYRPARVLMQDFTGVPAVVDLAAMRDAMKGLGGDPRLINPQVPVDLVIDHSFVTDEFGTPLALARNVELEYQRNVERYRFLKWGQTAFANFSVVPPGTGICHQVNLEFLSQTVWTRRNEADGTEIAYPDTLVGTDSHTTMVNGLAVLGWGVGGIEAEAAMLGQPISMLIPEVVGFKLTGKLREGVTATDLVLTVTQMLRKKGVVGKFVEFYGPGLDDMPVADRATIGNMAPEYGATCGFFPVDRKTIEYLRTTSRTDERIALVEAYAKAQGMWRTEATPDPVFTDTLELDLGDVQPSMAGPKRPQDRVLLSDAKEAFTTAMDVEFRKAAEVGQRHKVEGTNYDLGHGDVVLAAITSCTNTSNPSVMIGAGLLARNAVARGLKTKPWVKTSLAPGSQVVAEYFEKSGLQTELDALGFNLVGFGCGSCIGNSGPLIPEVSKAINDNDLVACSVLSGNRNFEGRVNPDIRANYLASPPLVVAYALAGSMFVDLVNDPLGTGSDGKPVYLRDIWPSSAEIQDFIDRTVTSASVQDPLRGRVHGRRALAGGRGLGRPHLRVGHRLDLRAEPALFRGHDQGAEAGDGHRQRPHPRPLPRFDHHRPHLARGQHPGRLAGRQLPAGAPGRGRRLQPVRHAARQPRDHDARHLRQHPHQEPDGPRRGRQRRRGRLHPPPALRRADVHLRRRHALPAGGRAARRARRQGIRHRLVPRLGREGHQPARHPRRHRRDLRAHPPLEPRRHGRGAARLRGRHLLAVARAQGRRDGHDPRPRGRPQAAPEARSGDHLAPTARVQNVPLVCRIDTLDELEYFRNGGILHYVLRQLAA